MFKRLREMQILQRLKRIPIVKTILVLLLIPMVCFSVIYHAYLPTLITSPSDATSLSPEVPDELFLKLCAKRLIDREQSFTMDLDKCTMIWLYITPYELRVLMSGTGYYRNYYEAGEGAFVCDFYYTNQGWIPVKTGESTGALLKNLALAKSARLEAGKK